MSHLASELLVACSKVLGKILSVKDSLEDFSKIDSNNKSQYLGQKVKLLEAMRNLTQEVQSYLSLRSQLANTKSVRYNHFIVRKRATELAHDFDAIHKALDVFKDAWELIYDNVMKARDDQSQTELASHINNTAAHETATKAYLLFSRLVSQLP